MITAKCKIILPSAWKPEPLRVRDRCIMDVTWMSEIVSSDGTEVTDKYFKATASLQNLDGDEWPQQPPPNKKNQNPWNKALIDTVCSYSRKLHDPLGEWIKDNLTWRARFDPLQMKVYRREKTFWFQLNSIGINRKCIFFSQRDAPAELPPKKLIITNLEAMNIEWQCTWPATFKDHNTTRSHSTFCKTLEKWEQDLMRDVDYVLDEKDLRSLLEENTPLYLVTDGGVKDNIGYYGW
eukprot:4300544-Ditylum_brightwellii.AAC.1